MLLEIDWQGARQVKQRFPGAIGIFILPPSIEELEARLKARGQDEPQVIARRLMAAGGEIAHAPECEYVIINQEFSVALSEPTQIVSAARLRVSGRPPRSAVRAARHPGGALKRKHFLPFPSAPGVLMARITVEDCLNQIPNRFKLTLAATYRARELAQGHAPRLDSKDKPTVTALREIAGGLTGVEMLRKVPT